MRAVVLKSVFGTKGPAFPSDTHKLTLIHNYDSNCYSQTSRFLCDPSQPSYSPLSSNHGAQFLYPSNSRLSGAHTYPSIQNRVLPPSNYLLNSFSWISQFRFLAVILSITLTFLQSPSSSPVPQILSKFIQGDLWELAMPTAPPSLEHSHWLLLWNHFLVSLRSKLCHLKCYTFHTKSVSSSSFSSRFTALIAPFILPIVTYQTSLHCPPYQGFLKFFVILSMLKGNIGIHL